MKPTEIVGSDSFGSFPSNLKRTTILYFKGQYMQTVIYNGQELKDNEWLVKVRNDNMGFQTKLTKKNELPKPFENWNNRYYGTIPIPVTVITEEFSDKWKLNSGDRFDMYRLGKSQSWVKVVHPLGYILEIRIQNFFEEVVPYLSDGKLIGNYRWIGNELERQ
jgi:hypothetical protein